MQPKLIHPENESGSTQSPRRVRCHCAAVNFQKIIVAVSTLLRSLGIGIHIKWINEELDDRFNECTIYKDLI